MCQVGMTSFFICPSNTLFPYVVYVEQYKYIIIFALNEIMLQKSQNE